MSWSSRITPLQVALLVLVIALGFVGARLFVTGKGDITRFIVAGDVFTDSASTPGRIHVLEGPGNDGQFNYRFALDPTTLTIDRHLGIEVDLALRAGRIGYPVVVWAASLGGQPPLVPWALVGVNIASLTAIGWCGATLARRWSRAPLAGLILPAWCGFLFAVSRDYADVLGAAFVVGAITAGARRRPVLYGALLAAACLTRELYIVLIAGLVLERAIDAVRARRLEVSRQDLAWSLPLGAFAAWQIIATQATGEIPLLSGENNRALPFQGILEAFGGWIDDIANLSSAPTQGILGSLALIQFAALVVFCIAVIRSISWPPVVEGVTPAWIALGIIAVLLSSDVWAAYNDLRNLSEFAVLGCILVLASSRSLVLAAVAVFGAFIATVPPRIVYI